MARHLHEQSGGDPAAQGPVPELANEPRSPRSDEDFPDAPETAERSGPGGDLTDEQLEDFADRLGLGGRDAGRDDGVGPRGRSEQIVGSGLRRVRRVAARLLVTGGGAMNAAGSRVRAAGERLSDD